MSGAPLVVDFHVVLGIIQTLLDWKRLAGLHDDDRVRVDVQQSG